MQYVFPFLISIFFHMTVFLKFQGQKKKPKAFKKPLAFSFFSVFFSKIPLFLFTLFLSVYLVNGVKMRFTGIVLHRKIF